MRLWGIFKVFALCVLTAAVAFGVRHERQSRRAEPTQPEAARPQPAPLPMPTSNVDFPGVLLAGETVEIAPKIEGRLEQVRVRPGDHVAFLGVLLAGETVEVAPKIEGRLEQVLVRPGDHVAKGAPVARLEVRTLRADLRLALASLADAKQRLKRRIPLAHGVISAEELADARAQVVARRNHVEHLKAGIADAFLPAPFEAVVAARYVNPGTFVGPSRPVVRLLSGDSIRVRFAIPETDAGKVAIRSRVRITVQPRGERFTGVVESVAPEVDAAARMIFAVATVDVPSEARAALSSGMAARVSPL
jgi:RND family efflux transporter MFP subunit